MKTFKILLPVLAVIVLLASCSSDRGITIEKRRYGKGYYAHIGGGRENAEAKQVLTQLPANEKTAALLTPPAENEKKESVVEETTVPVKQEEIKTAYKAPEKHLPVPGKTSVAHESRKPFPILKKSAAPQPSASDDELTQILMIILAIFLSPIAVYLKEGITKRFWLDLICWLLGGGLFFSPFFYGGALMLFAIIYALLIVLDVI